MPTIEESLALAVQYHQTGNLAQAEQIYRQILQVNPAEANSLHLLGMLAYQVGQHQAALDLILQATSLLPHVAELHSNLAGVYLALGRCDEALISYQEALRLRPDLPELHNNLGDALARQARWQEAAVSYRKALALRPSYADAHHKLGLALAEQGRVEEALASYAEALHLRTDFPEAHNNLGNLLKQLGRPAEAEVHYRAALRLWPQNADIVNHLGAALADQGRLPEAEASHREALRLRPDHPDAHYNLGMALTAQGRQDEAIAAYEQTVRFKPDYAEAWNNLGNAYKDQRRLDDAIACYQKAITAKPELQSIHSNLLFALHCRADYDPETTYAEHLRWAAQFGALSARHRPLHPIRRDPGRRLRIGYVSGDFRDHVMGHYIEAVVGAHDRARFEVFCYANVSRPDALTQRVMASADHWRSILGLPDAPVADLIRQDQIDVLIDLAGHTAGNRLGVFTTKPAPIQVTHCGYAATTGLAAIDYRLMDAHCDPPGRTERFHSEKLVRLPKVHWCYVPPRGPEVGPLPAERTGVVTFGSFNALHKVTDWMIGLWSQILNDLPGSRMIALTGMGSTVDEGVLAAFSRNGVERARVTLVGRQGRQAYFRLFHGADICLDTYPYSGCNTTADALWMGVPVVNLAGASCVSRLGVSALVHVGLEDLVTPTPASYAEAAIRLARDLPRLKELRSRLRARLERSPLMDVPGFTRDLEAAYRAMWEQYCKTSGRGLIP